MGDACLLREAALGRREAQGALASACLFMPEVPITERVVMAEPFARLAAEHGEPDDLLILAGVLHLRASHLAKTDEVRAARLFTEVGDILDHVADCGEALPILAVVLNSMCNDGDEDAAIRLNRLMERLTPAEAVAVNVATRQLVAPNV